MKTENNQAGILESVKSEVLVVIVVAIQGHEVRGIEIAK